MHEVQRITHAYSQAPWRKQMQIIGLFLLILIAGALVAGIYLNVSARAGVIGRSIQGMQVTARRLRRENENLNTMLASLTSYAEMEKRARDLGFRPVVSEDIVYLVVPGYTQRPTAVLGKPPQPAANLVTVLPPEYTQSLFDWIREWLSKTTAPLREFEK